MCGSPVEPINLYYIFYVKKIGICYFMLIKKWAHIDFESKISKYFENLDSFMIKGQIKVEHI